MLADGAVALLRERSVDALNVSALARWMGVTRQALSERLWSSGGTRRRILQLTVLAFADRWSGWVQAALLEDPPVPALPRSAEEVHGLRVWSALTELARGELARGNPDPAAAIVATRELEREVMRDRCTSWLGTDVSDQDLLELGALADGLRADLILSAPRSSFDEAHRLLSRRLEAIRLSTAGNERP